MIEASGLFTALGITLRRVAIGLVINLLCTILVAYPLSKDKQTFKSRTIYVGFFIFTMIFNGGLIPTYIVIKQLKMLDTIWALILPNAVTMYYVLLMLNFFRGIPKDIEEAAYVDGCGTLRTFFTIMLPDARPILTSCFLFAFVWQWTDGFYSTMFLGTTKLVSTSLSRIVDSLSSFIMRELGIQSSISVAYSNCILSTGTLMIILPLIVLYLFAQRGFVESLSQTGIKM
jgi:ABC-type glycerol-3-phosphate transport system permease component